ncbi:DinB family protein [Vibrio tritonius]|uniref:DinB family protein n=1 Tax=Vibrio tritonius TaxID=1435069 RepID=UPI00315D94CA
MDLASNFVMMARYNQRMNVQLLAACRHLSSAQLQRNTRSYFVSVLDYWNHLLQSDITMLNCLVQHQLVISEKDLQGVTFDWDDQRFLDDLNAIIEKREEVDHLIVNMTHHLSNDLCHQRVHYVGEDALEMDMDLNAFLLHLFNHQTHHRGQLACILSQFGLDVGVTDLPHVVPELLERTPSN